MSGDEFIINLFSSWSLIRRWHNIECPAKDDIDDWDLNVNLEICERREEFSDWLNTMGKVFAHKDLANQKRVKLVAIKLCGRAVHGGNNCKNPECMGKPLITSGRRWRNIWRIGLPICFGQALKRMWNPIIKRLEKNLSIWKSNTFHSVVKWYLKRQLPQSSHTFQLSFQMAGGSNKMHWRLQHEFLGDGLYDQSKLGSGYDHWSRWLVLLGKWLWMLGDGLVEGVSWLNMGRWPQTAGLSRKP